jgi:putative peptidoglycan lipid II flippase
VMTSTSTDLVAGVLRFFTLGLLPFSLFQLFLRAFYAMQDTKTPFLINCGAVALNTAVNIPMFAWLGVRGLAAGHAIAYVFGVSVQARALSRRIGGLDGRVVLASLVRIVAASLIMGVLVWGASLATEAVVGTTTFTAQVVALAVPIGVGVVAYLAVAGMLGIRELDYARSLVGRRLSRR